MNCTAEMAAQWAVGSKTVCTIQVRAMAGGAGLIRVDPRSIESAMEQARQVTLGGGGGALTWPGLLRRLDRSDAGYRR